MVMFFDPNQAKQRTDDPCTILMRSCLIREHSDDLLPRHQDSLGLVFASDSRTNAGMDYVTTYGKMHSFVWPGERFVTILTAGNLATTQAVLNRIQRSRRRRNRRQPASRQPHVRDRFAMSA